MHKNYKQIKICMLPIATKNETFLTHFRKCIWNIQGVGLPDSNNKAGSASRLSALSEPRRADTERTPSKPRADPKPTSSELKANQGSTFGVRSGVRLGLVVTVRQLPTLFCFLCISSFIIPPANEVQGGI